METPLNKPLYLTQEEYREHPAIAASDLMRFYDSQYAYWYKRNVYSIEKNTKSLELGNKMHKCLLEGWSYELDDIVVSAIQNERASKGEAPHPNARATKSYKEEAGDRYDQNCFLLKEEEFMLIDTICNNFENNDFLSAMLDKNLAVIENSYFTKDPTTGIDLKIKPDIFIPQNDLIIDLKSGRSGGKWDNEVWDYRHDLRAAFYSKAMSIVRNTKLKARDYVFIRPETSPPFRIEVLKLDPRMADLAEELVEESLVNFKDAIENDDWGHPWYMDRTAIPPKDEIIYNTPTWNYREKYQDRF